MTRVCTITPQLKIGGLYSLFKRVCTKDFFFTGESHDFHEVVCVLSGSVSITAGTDVVTLSEGSAIWHPPMEFHSVRAAEGTAPVILVFSFTAEVFPTLKNRIFSFSTEDRTLLEDVLQTDPSVFIRKNYVLYLKEGHNPLQAQRLMDTLTLFLLRIFANSTEPSLPPAHTRAHTYTLVTTYIKDNLSSVSGAAQIADACNMSIIGVQKLFQKYAGVGVMHYVNHLKISHAIEMLRRGHTSKETALMLGFSNQNYFSTVFKRITGLSPSKYLRQNNQNV